MAWQFTPYTAPLILTACAALLLGLYVWRRRHSPGAKELAVIMLAICAWSLAYALQLSRADLAGQTFLGKTQYFAIVTFPVAWICFAAKYSGREKWVSPRNLVFLSIVPAITVLIAWTNEFHSLLWRDARLVQADSFVVKTASYGFWFWVHMAYAYSLGLIGTVLILETLFRSRSLYRSQTIALLVAVLAPWAGNVAYVSRQNPFPYLDLTPFALTISGAALAWAIFRFRLADLIPIAHARIIEGLNDGVIVLDAQNRILDMNPTAQRMLNHPIEEVLGYQFEETLSDLLDDPAMLEQGLSSGREITLGENGDRRVYDIQLSQLTDKPGRTTGTIVSLRDVTARKRMEDEMQRNRDRLEEQVREQTSELSRANEQLLEEMAERKGAQERLRASEELYRRILDSCHDIIAVFDENANLLYSNRALPEQTGYERDEFDTGFSFETVHPDDRAKITEWFFRVLNGEPARGEEYRGVSKSGEIHWIEANANLVQWPGAEKAIVNVLRDVTDRKQAEDALKESEQLYRALIEDAKEIIYTIDLTTGMVASANRYTFEVLAYEKEGVINGKHFLEFVHPDDRARVTGQLSRNMMGLGRIPNFPFRIRKADGAYIDVEQNATIFRDADGSAKFLLAVSRDVTERNRMEEALRLSEERYHQILDSAHDMIIVIDGDNRILSANKAFCEQIGYEIDEVNEIGTLKLVHPEDRDEAEKWMLRVRTGEQMRSFQYRAIHKNGLTRWLEANADPIRWPGAERAVVNVLRDITERKRIEEALKESEERYRTLVESSLTAICVVQNGMIKFANKRLAELSEFELKDLAGMSLVDLAHPDDREAVHEVIKRRIPGDFPPEQYQFRGITKAGQLRWIQTFGARIEYERRPALIVNVIDVTDRKRAEEALKESEQRFRSLVELTSDWLWEVDCEGRYTYASPKVKELLGYDPEELIGKTPFDHHMPHGEANRIRSLFEDVTRSAKEFTNLENICIHKDGRHVVFETSGLPIFDERGSLTGYRGVDRDITNRRRAEDALRESEERYRNMFWEAPDIFYTMDLQTWLITDANKYALEATGYGPEDMGKLHVSHIIHPDDFERAAGRLRDMVLNKDRMPHFPLRILSRSGEALHIEQSGVIFWDEDGNARTFLGLAHDVTYRKKQDEMIRKRNERLTALYELARTTNESLDLDVVIDLTLEMVPRITKSDAVCVYSFDESRRVLLHQASRGFPKHFLDATDEMQWDEGLHGYVIKTRKPLVTNDMQEHPLLGRRSYVSNLEYKGLIIAPLIAKGKLLGTLTVARKPGNPYEPEDLELVAAVANQVAVAMENANLYSELSRREAHLQSILETSLDGIAVTSEKQRLEYGNSALASLFGYESTDEVIGTETLKYFAPQSLPVLNQIREKLRRAESIDGIVEFTAIRKDGSTFEAEMRLGFFFEKGQRLEVAVIRDVTQRKAMQFQLQQSGKLAAIGELAAGVAHEINNPIATLRVQTELMNDIVDEEQPKLSADFLSRLQKYFGIVEDQVQKCQSVTNSLLSFSRSQRNSDDSIDINELVRKTADLIIRLTPKKPRIELDLDERLPLFHGDPNRLQQVFVNLLNNAVKAIDCGGLITVATRQDHNRNIHIEFKDSGPGIPPEIRERIFDPFFTTRAEGEGTGLGLSISYYIISQINGTLHVESVPGHGARFVITLKSGDNSKGMLSHAS